MTSTDPAPPGRVLRRRSGTVACGVAGGVADHLDLPVTRVRLAFTLLAGLGGAGFLAYGALWVCCPPEPPGVDRPDDPRVRRQGYGLASLGLALALGLSAVGEQTLGWLVGPLGLALVGVAVVWREADGGEPRRRRRLVAGTGGGLRVAAGAVLVATGIAMFLFGRLDVGQVQFGLLAAVATLVGVVVVTVPWWVRLGRELTAERRARIRGQERAEIAAHLHDSVLQTLALIQRHTEADAASEGAREVRRLARRQERELRRWLYGVDADGAAATTFGAALAAAAAEVEDTHAVTVAPVLVGPAADVVLDDAQAGLVAAAREAMVNAAKHAGVTEISVYAEVEDTEVAVFVRDRGAGFDPETVAADRHGLADSIRARVTRLGGTVRVRTAPGEGTEIGLTMPRAPATAPGATAPAATATGATASEPADVTTQEAR